MPEVESILSELGLSQYLNTFLEHGFDTWDTILDITESDLDALGVRLGHRRKLQRRIANARGIAPNVALVPTVQPSIEGAKLDAPERPLLLDEPVQKRKYRRHPKPDSSAPERPPSAYVLFSNKIREDLKGQNWSFTEIAKLVGENWQVLLPSEKEIYETQAKQAKEKYNTDLSAYKKTPDYQRYTVYLRDFKLKHPSRHEAGATTKKVRLEAVASQKGGHHTRTSGENNSSAYRTGSGPESHSSSSHSHTRHERFSSTVSAADSSYSSVGPASDDVLLSPMSTRLEEHRTGISLHHCGCSPRTDMVDESIHDASNSCHRPNPWNIPNDQAPNPVPTQSWEGSRIGVSSPGMHENSLGGSTPLTNLGSPTLLHEPCSADSSSSGSSGYFQPRTPTDGPLAMQTLTFPRTGDSDHKDRLGVLGSAVSPDSWYPHPHQPTEQIREENCKRPAPTLSSGFTPVATIDVVIPPCSLQAKYSAETFVPEKDGDITHPALVSWKRSQAQEAEPRLDGMSALLRAGEIVATRVPLDIDVPEDGSGAVPD